MDQLVFTKRLKIYETLKQDANCSFEDAPYDVEFLPKETLGPLRSNLGTAKRDENAEIKAAVFVSAKNFTDTASETFEGNTQFEEAFVNTIKDSQLDYILKFDNKVSQSNHILTNAF